MNFLDAGGRVQAQAVKSLPDGALDFLLAAGAPWPKRRQAVTLGTKLYPVK